MWVDVKGFEKHYQVSNMGNVRSKDRYLFDKNGRRVFHKGREIKPCQNSHGYLRVPLKNENQSKAMFVHRLVALHFVENENPQINTVVNHLDSNPQNNDSRNLEWTTLKGNMQHAARNGRLVRTQTWIDRLNSSLDRMRKAVVGYDPTTGETLLVLNGLNECSKYGYEPSCVCLCCKGERKTHKGLAWKYAE